MHNLYAIISSRHGSWARWLVQSHIHLLILMWRPHTFKEAGIKMELIDSMSEKCSLDMCLASKSLVSNVGPSFIRYKRLFSTSIQDGCFVDYNLQSKLEVETDGFYCYCFWKGPTLKLISSKLGTCQDQICFTMACHTLFSNKQFWICEVHLPFCKPQDVKRRMIFKGICDIAQ